MPNYTSSWFNERLVMKGNNLDRLLTQTLDYRDDAIAQGFCFYMDYHQPSIPQSGKTYAELTTPSDKFFALINREVVTDQESSFFRSYMEYSPATLLAPITIRNLRNEEGLVSGTSLNVCSEPATIEQDSVSTNTPIFGFNGAGNRGSGGVNSNSLFRLYEPNTKILLEWENTSSSSIYMATMMAWFEIDQSAV